MTVKKIYVAEDGKEFTNEAECREYEARQQDPLKDFRHKLTVLTSADSCEPLKPCEYNDADEYIVIIVTEELTLKEADILEEFLEFDGKIPDNINLGKGIYIWNYGTESYSFIPLKLWEALKNNPIINQIGEG